MDDLERSQELLALDTLWTARIDKGRVYMGEDELLEIGEKNFAAITEYQCRLAQRRVDLEHALRSALAEVEAEQQEIDELLGAELIRYSRSALKGKKKKEISTPSGLVKLRKLPTTMDVTSSARQLAWAESHLPGAVRRGVAIKALGKAQESAIQDLIEEGILRKKQVTFTTSVNLPMVKKHLKDTGEVPAGMKVVDDRYRLHIKERNSAVIGTATVASHRPPVQAERTGGDANELDPLGNRPSDGARCAEESHASVSPAHADTIAALEGRDQEPE